MLVLMFGVVAAKRPGKGLDHWFAAQHIAPAFTAVAAFAAAYLLLIELRAIGSGTFDPSVVGLFVVNGHAQLTVDPFAAIFSFIAFAGTLVVMILSLDHFGENQIHKAEYYSLLMFATVAASLAAAASDLIAIYLSIEFLSLVSYVLAAYSKTDRRSAEAGLKYFLYGAACSAVMLYGMSILFGLTGGNTALSAIAQGFRGGPAASAAGWVAVMFMLVGLGFKLALVPFHFWAPDTYEGAPTPITAFLSVVSKAAGLAVVIRFLTVIGSPSAPAAYMWYWMLVVLTAISMFYGNMVAIWQHNIKRMLAYSSIAQVGYLMIGVLTAMNSFAANAPLSRAAQGHALVWSSALTQATSDGPGWVRFDSVAPWDLPGVLIYVFAYLLMNLGAFAVVVAVGRRLKSNDISSYAGLMRRAPLMASALAVFLVSLAGVPPTAGFLGKWFIFGGAIMTGLVNRPELIVLAVLGVVNSVISAYYYLNVVRLMFFARGESKSAVVCPFAMNAVVAVLLILTIAVLVFANPVSQVALRSVYSASLGLPTWP